MVSPQQEKHDGGDAGNVPPSDTRKVLLMQDYSSLPLFSLQPEIKEISLSKGRIAIVDAADHEWLSQYKWYACSNGHQWYARRSTPYGDIRMHRAIMNAPAGMFVDHVDGNGLNNRRSNLRICTQAENVRYRNKPSTNSSGYKGVIKKKGCNRWEASIVKSQQRFYLGLYLSAEEAARAYDAAAIFLFGSFAFLNFPEESAK